MDNHTKSKLALIMLPSQLRRTILLTLLMIAALTIVAINDIKNSKKNLEKMKRTKCLTSYVIKNVKKECKKDALKKQKLKKKIKKKLNWKRKTRKINIKKISGKNEEDKVPYQI